MENTVLIKKEIFIMIKLKILLPLLCFSAFVCCAGSSNKASSGSAQVSDNVANTQMKLIERISPATQYRVGDTIKIEVALAATATVDSMFLYVDDKRVGLSDNKYSVVSNSTMPLGRHTYRLDAYKDGEKESRMSNFELVPLAAPRYYDYRVEQSYPHNEAHYTQGLIFAHGTLYEGTGMNGESLLAQVDLMSGKRVRSVDLDDKYFGEGITLLGDKMYQLTWQSGKALVYNVHNFKVVEQFDYQGEGWGITTDGEVLYMSNGSNKITVRNADDFSIIRTISVYTERGALNYLNELEWIDGELWANVYMTDYIARIDPKTGLVVGVVDLAGLLPAADRTPRSEVLNGIAYDKSSGRIFVTGKYWSKMFEISVF